MKNKFVGSNFNEFLKEDCINDIIKKPVVLIYKRTHKNDPRENGIFGIEDCMKRVRDWQFDSVIGIGGKYPWKEDIEIAKRINWIGINATKRKSIYEHSVVTFEKFCLFEEKGEFVEEIAPKFAEYIYNSRCRFVKSTSLNDEILRILDIAKDYDTLILSDKEVKEV